MIIQEEIVEKWALHFEKLLNCEELLEKCTYVHKESYNNPYTTPSKEKLSNRLK